MKIVLGDLLTINKEKYLVLDSLLHNGQSYVFVNKLTLDENSTKEFYVFKVIGNTINIVKNKNVLDEILPLFSKNVQNLIDKMSTGGSVWI